MATYYDDEEGDIPAEYYDEESAGPAPLPTQAQAIALAPQVADPASFRVPITSPGGPMGAASREFYSGRPGLFVQGGPTVPAGTIEVNGQLERSQAAPQPVPWWITQADQFKDQLREERRQDEFLRGFMSQMGHGTNAPAALEKMQQIQGRLQLQADLKAGMPFRDALVKNSANLYAGSRNALTSLARIAAPPKLIPTGVTEFTGSSGARYFLNPATGAIVQAHTQPERASKGEVTPVDEYRALTGDIRSLKKDRADAIKYDDKEEAARLDTVIKETEARRGQLTPKKSAAAASPAPTQQTQTSPRIALFRQLEAQNPTWNKQQVIDAVNAQLKK